METPQRFYTLDIENEKGKAASGVSWVGWKDKHCGYKSQVPRTPFLGLLNSGLKETNRLVQSEVDDFFKRGIRGCNN
jgi:hypothetical protein